MTTPGILFVCGQFGARSLIAAAFARQQLGDEAIIESAGFQTGTIGPLIGRIMEEIDLPIRLESPPTVFEHFSSEQDFDYVVFLCDTAIVDLCELFQGEVDELFNHGEILVRWTVPPFSDLTGSEEERLRGAREIRDGIRDNVSKLLRQIESGNVQETFPWEAVCAPRQ